MRNDNNYSKGHELKPYEALSVIVGLFITFTIVRLKGPNKPLNRKKNYNFFKFLHVHGDLLWAAFMYCIYTALLARINWTLEQCSVIVFILQYHLTMTGEFQLIDVVDLKLISTTKYS